MHDQIIGAALPSVQALSFLGERGSRSQLEL